MKLSILAAPVPGTGTPTAKRGSVDGGAGSDFGALLGGLAKDAPAETTPALVPESPPSAEAADSADASVTGALVPGNGEDPEFGSQQRAFSPAEGEPQLSDVPNATGQPVAGAAEAAGVTSLLRLAARAAAPGGSAPIAATIASDVAVVATIAPGAKVAGSVVPAGGGAHASGYDHRKASMPKDGTPAAAVADAMAPVSTAVAALLGATAASVSPTLPVAAGITQPLPRSEAPEPAGASGPEAGIALSPASAGAVPPTTDDASTSPPMLPTTTVGEVESAPVAPAATSVDAAIGAGPVRVESYLGFDRGARIGAAAAPGGGAPVAPSRSEGSSSADLRSPAVLDPVSAGADVDGVDASSPRPPNTGDVVLSDGDVQSVAPSAAPHAAEAAVVATPSQSASVRDVSSPIGTGHLAGSLSTKSAPEAEEAAATDAAGGMPARSLRAPDAAASAGTERLAAPPSATLAPERDEVAAADAPGVTPSHPKRAPDMASSAGTGRLAVPPSTTLAPEARRSAVAATSFVASRPVTTEASSPDAVALSIAPTMEPATDEPNTPASTMGPVTTASVAALAMPSPQAAPPVAQQVADGVAGLAATVVPDEPGSDTRVAPARTMALQLSPAGLGTLTVRLHVAGRALDVHLEASDGRTAALIDRDRDALAGALRGKDYQLQTLSVTTHDATMSGGTHAERGTESRSADAGSADPGSPGRSRDEPSGSRSGGGGAREAPERAVRPTSRPAVEASLERGGSSLFV